MLQFFNSVLHHSKVGCICLFRQFLRKSLTLFHALRARKRIRCPTDKARTGAVVSVCVAFANIAEFKPTWRIYNELLHRSTQLMHISSASYLICGPFSWWSRWTFNDNFLASISAFRNRYASVTSKCKVSKKQLHSRVRHSSRQF